MNRLKALWPAWRREQEREMREELESLTALAGRKELGNITLALEDVRAAWGWTWLDGLFADVRYSIRTLGRQPAFASIAVLSLALAIGANSAMFSFADAMLLRPLPIAHPERLYGLSRHGVGFVRACLAGHRRQHAEAEPQSERQHRFRTRRAEGEPRPMREQPIRQNIPHHRSDQQRENQSAPIAPVQHRQKSEYETRRNFRNVQDRHEMEIETAVERDKARTLKRLQYRKRNDRPENRVRVAEMEKVA